MHCTLVTAHGHTAHIRARAHRHTHRTTCVQRADGRDSVQWISLLDNSVLLDNSARVARAPEVDDIVNNPLHRLLVPLPERVVHHLLPLVRAPLEAVLELSEEAPLLAQAPTACDARRRPERRSDVAVLVARSIDKRRAVGLGVVQPHLVLRATQGESSV